LIQSLDQMRKSLKAENISERIDSMQSFKVGDVVTILATKIIGTVIYFNEKDNKYLVRFNGTQQLYYADTELVPYSK